MELQGALVRDVARAPVGRVLNVLLGPDTLDAHWLQVGLEGDGSVVLVPAVAASESVPGELLLPYPLEVIAAARPPAGRALSATDAEALREHYGFSDGRAFSDDVSSGRDDGLR